jgi:hypothetical protein
MGAIASHSANLINQWGTRVGKCGRVYFCETEFPGRSANRSRLRRKRAEMKLLSILRALCGITWH